MAFFKREFKPPQQEFGPDKDGMARLNPMPLKAHPVVVHLLMIVAAVITYVLMAIFAFVFGSSLLMFIGGFVAIFILALPIIRNIGFRKVGIEGIRAVPPHPGLVSYLISRQRNPHELIWIVDRSGKLHQFVAPAATREAVLAGGSYFLRSPHSPNTFSMKTISPEGVPIHLFFQSVPMEGVSPEFNIKMVDGTLRALQEQNLLGDDLRREYDEWVKAGKDVMEQNAEAVKALEEKRKLQGKLRSYLPIDPRWMVPFLMSAEELKETSDYYAMAEHGLAKQLRRNQKMLLALMGAMFPLFLGMTIFASVLKGG
jgi:hypothetical protein